LLVGSIKTLLSELVSFTCQLHTNIDCNKCKHNLLSRKWVICSFVICLSCLFWMKWNGWWIKTSSPYVTCLARTIIYPSKGANGYIPFITLFKHLKNGSCYVFLLFISIKTKKLNKCILKKIGWEKNEFFPPNFPK
jgi:hypothetical protein